MYFLTHWPDVDRFRPHDRWPFDDADKVVHAGLYVVWTVLWWWVISGFAGRVTHKAATWLAVGGVAYAVFDELTQAIVGRQPDVLDLACDSIGIIITVAVLSRLQQSGWFPRQTRHDEAAIRHHTHPANRSGAQPDSD